MAIPTVSRKMRFFLSGAAFFFLSAQTVADTIVLKNGRRIVALNAVEEGDKVRYMTSAGELSLPKSIVDRIEKGGFAATSGPPGDATANLTITTPEVRPVIGREDIQRAAVREGSIDREYIGKLESEARQGHARANFNAALGHHAAAIFELSRGDLEHALSDERTAVTYAPDEPALLMNVAYIYLRRNEYKQALDYLDRAKRFVPDNPDVSKLAGWAYYGLNQLDEAVAEWKHALALHPDKELQAALEAALRDLESSDKATRFVNTCNAFNIPLLFLADVSGFMIGSAVERAGIIRHGAKFIAAVSQAVVPKISVVVRKCYGAGLYAMAGPAFGTNAVIALPTAQIAVMGPEAAINAVFANQIAEMPEDQREPFRKMMEARYAEDIDIFRLASELIVDTITPFESLRDELIARYSIYQTKEARFSECRNPIYPV